MKVKKHLKLTWSLFIVLARVKIKIAAAGHFPLQLLPTPSAPNKKIPWKGLASEKIPAEVRPVYMKKKRLQAEEVPSPYQFFNGRP